MSKNSIAKPDVWDTLAVERNKQLSSTKDLSYHEFIKPEILRRVPRSNSLIDVGCGLGHLTAAMSKTTKKLVGIDPSPASIRVAKDNFPGIEFQVSSLEGFHSTETYDVLVINMVLHAVPNLETFLRKLKLLTHQQSEVVFSMCHPFFWPQYKKLLESMNFSYSERSLHEIPFTISDDPLSLGKTPYFHRPVGAYVDAFFRTGFTLSEFAEPMPSSELERKYSREWCGPRFVFGKLLPR